MRNRLGDFAELRAAVGDERTALAAERAALADQRAEFSELKTELRDRLGELAELRATVGAERTAIAAERAALEDQRAEFSELNTEMRNRLGDFAELRAAVGAERAALAAERAALADQRADFPALKTDLRSQLGEFADLRAALATDRTALAAERAASADQRADFAALSAEVRNQLGELAAARAGLAAERSDLAAERAALREERAGLSASRVQLQGELEDVAALRTAVAAERSNLVAEREALEAQHAAALANLTAEKDYLAAKLEDTRGRFVFERDALIVRRDGLAPFLTDPRIEWERRLAICERAILEGRIDEVVAILESVRHHPEDLRVASSGLSMCRYLLKSGLLKDVGWSPHPGEPPPPVRQPICFSPPGATRKVLLAFLGVGHRFWMQIAALHPFLTPHSAHVLYLCDTTWSSYMLGVDSVGSGYQAALAGLRDICRTLAEGEAEIFCYGTSMGGFAALRYGLDLDARKVLAIDAVTTLTGEVGELRVQDERVLSERLGDLALDLKPLYLQREAVPEVSLYYAECNGRDAAHAERFADVSRARVIAVEGGKAHATLARLAASGRLPAILAECLGESPSA
ncbi:MAG: hypothetical protein JOZ40_06610 [Methylobacteriaceae bacterium]|nr:hypothetical protein [Methylobacteriaceae bacterium]